MDPEGCSVKLTLTPTYPYLEIIGDKMFFNPKDYIDVGPHLLLFTITDP